MQLIQRLYSPTLYHKLLLFVAVLIPNTDSLPVRLASVSILLVGLWWIASGNFKLKLSRLRENKLLWLFLALFLINIPGLLFTDHSASGFEMLGRKLPLLLFPLVIGTSFDLTKQQINQILIAFITGLFLMSLFTFREGIVVLLDREDLTTMVDLTLLHRPYAGLFSAFSLVALVHLYRQYTPTIAKAAIALAIPYFVFYIYILYAKMTVIALLVLALALAIWWLGRKISKTASIVACLLFIAGFIGFVATNEKASTVVEKVMRFEDFSYQEYNIHLVSSVNIRYINWGCSIETIRQDRNWLTGLGIGHAQPLLNACYKDRNPWIFEQSMNSHNEYLDEILRNGIIGLLILIAVLLAASCKSIRDGNYLYFSFILLLAVSFITENFLARQAGIMFFALFNALFAFHTSHSFTNPPKV